ncbi:hypothetical protein D3C71_1926330 [compost metagenome]
MVAVAPVYSTTVELSSLIVVIQLRMAPDMTPGAIIRPVVLKNVFIGGTPRLIDASSTLLSSCVRMAVLERIVYGSLRTT